MVTKLQISVRPAAETDRQQLANLIHFETQVHRHLDWRSPLDWLSYSPFLVAEHNHRLVGAFVCPPDPPGVAWIRLFAIRSDWEASDVWSVLWPAGQDALTIHSQEITVAAIPLQTWFEQLLKGSGFTLLHQVILLHWQSTAHRPRKANATFSLRPMNSNDLSEVAQIDSAAFGPLWTNSLDSIHLAYQQSALATVAEDETGIIGYQISTASPMGAHLARLAVRPGNQSRGVGYGLVDDMLNQFERRGVSRVTVNTQNDNSISLRLYEKAGFRETGEWYPVYQCQIHSTL